VAAGGAGFLYYISRTGVTGASVALRDELGAEVEAIRERVELPVAVGFGISTPEQATSVAGVADGVVVGSALIKVLEAEGVEGVGRFVLSLREAMDAR
jgi:tryptophan synthase alpha chain